MQKKITFRGMETSQAISDYVETHIAKFNTFLDTEKEPVHLEVILEAHRTHHHHRVEIILKSPHYHCIAHHEGPDLYEQVNIAVNRIETQLRNQKERIVTAHKRGAA